MRIAVVLSHLPRPEGSTAGRCAVAMLRGIRADGHDLRVLAPDWEGAAEQVPADLGVETLPVSLNATSSLDRVRRWTKPRSSLARGAFADRARAISEGVDAVFLDEIDTAPLARLMRAPALVHLNDWTGRELRPGAPWSASARDSWRLIRADRRAVKRSTHLAGNSEELVSDLRSAGAKDVQLIRLGLDPDLYVPAQPVADPIAGMIGSASRPPTRDAIRVLLEEVWPQIHAAVPEAILRLAGHGMTPDSFPSLRHVAGVEWVGEVQSAAGFLRSLALQLYPVTSGGGTKINVLEALFLGVPVVTTMNGLEGISDNGGLFASDDLRAVVSTATRLLRDPAARAQRSQQAVVYARAHHSPAVVGGRVAEALAAVA